MVYTRTLKQLIPQQRVCRPMKYGPDRQVCKCVVVEVTSLLDRKAALRSDKGNCTDKYYYSACCRKYVDTCFAFDIAVQVCQWRVGAWIIGFNVQYTCVQFCYILTEYSVYSFGNAVIYVYPSCSFQVISCPYSVVANKRKIRTATEAVSDIPNGASLLVGGKIFVLWRDVEIFVISEYSYPEKLQDHKSTISYYGCTVPVTVTIWQ